MDTNSLCWIVDLYNFGKLFEFPQIGDGSTFNCNNDPSPAQPEPMELIGDALEDLFLEDETLFPPPNISRPPVYRPPVSAPSEIPERKLPQEADGQTDFDTPDGRSISLQESLKNRKYGKLLWSPLSKQTVDVYAPKLDYLPDKLKDQRTESAKNFDDYLKGEKELSLWEKSAMAFTDTPSGLGGELNLMFGLNWFRELVNANKQASKLALMQVHDFIPKTIKFNRQDVKFSQSFSDENVDIGKTGLENIEKLLGVEIETDKDDENYGKLKYLGELPTSLLNIRGQEKLIKIKNYPEFFIWFIKQFDALIGEFPIKIKIKDADLTEEGNQQKLIKIANIAEGLSEIFGLAFQSASMGDPCLHILLRLVPEIVRIRQEVLVSGDVLQACREFLGYREKEVKKEIQSNFTLIKDSANIAKLLEPEKVKYKSIEFDDKTDTLMDYLLRLQYIASLQKQQLVKSFDEFEDFMKQQTEESQNNLDKWNDFLKIINDPTSQFNFQEKPSRVRDVEASDEPAGGE